MVRVDIVRSILGDPTLEIARVPGVGTSFYNRLHNFLDRRSNRTAR